MSEELESLADSLRGAVRYLGGILEEIDAGTYTRDAAALDVEALTGSETLGYLFDLERYADSEEA